MLRFILAAIIVVVVGQTIWDQSWSLVAQATGNKAWHSQSYKEDRFKNAVAISVEPVYEDYTVIVQFTITNNSEFGSFFNGLARCYGGSTYDTMSIPDDAWFIPAGETRVFSLEPRFTSVFEMRSWKNGVRCEFLT